MIGGQEVLIFSLETVFPEKKISEGIFYPNFPENSPEMDLRLTSPILSFCIRFSRFIIIIFIVKLLFVVMVYSVHVCGLWGRVWSLELWSRRYKHKQIKVRFLNSAFTQSHTSESFLFFFTNPENLIQLRYHRSIPSPISRYLAFIPRWVRSRPRIFPLLHIQSISFSDTASENQTRGKIILPSSDAN